MTDFSFYSLTSDFPLEYLCSSALCLNPTSLEMQYISQSVTGYARHLGHKQVSFLGSYKY